MDRTELIKALARKNTGSVYAPKGLNVASTGEESAVKPRKRCEWKRGGNLWYNGNYGVSHKTPQAVAAALPVEAQAIKPTFKGRQRHGKHALTSIADKWATLKRQPLSHPSEKPNQKSPKPC